MNGNGIHDKGWIKPHSGSKLIKFLCSLPSPEVTQKFNRNYTLLNPKFITIIITYFASLLLTLINDL